MKTRTLVNLASAALLMGSMSAAQALTTVSLSTDTVTTAGGQVSLTFSFDSTDGVIGGGTNFHFDSNVFSFVSFTWDPAYYTGAYTGPNNGPGNFGRYEVDCAAGGAPATCTNGYADGQSLVGDPDLIFGFSGDFQNGDFGTHVLGTLVLDVASGLAAGFYDVAMTYSDNEVGSPGGWQYLSGRADPQPDFISGGVTVNPIPLPAAAWLMIGGLASLLGFRRS